MTLPELLDEVEADEEVVAKEDICFVRYIIELKQMQIHFWIPLL